MGVVKKKAFIILCMSCLCGCNVDTHLAGVTERVAEMYSQTKDWSELPIRTITWRQAVLMLRTGNMDLLEADDRIRQSERNSLSIYTDLIPTVSYYGYMTRNISQLANDVSTADLSSNINVNFSVPTLTHIPYRVYAAMVNTYAEVKAKEGRERELVSRLYHAVRTRRLEQAKRELAAAESGAVPSVSDKQAEAQRRQADEKYWKELADLLGNRTARWDILPESVPVVRWEDYSPLLDRPGDLVLCEFAMRLERARMAQYGVAFTYLPTINTSIYSPALFSSSGGTYQGTFLNADDTRLNLSLSYTLDTRLSAWDTYQDSKAHYERQKQRVADALMDHRNKVRALRESMDEYMAWRSYMHKRMEHVRSLKPQDAEGLMERARTLAAMKLELLNQEIAAVESEAAAVLEYGMPDELEKRPPAQRKR